MESSFSVSTNNRFAFFMGDEDDPGDMMIQAESVVPETKLPQKSTADSSPSQKRNEKNLKQREQKPPVQQKKSQAEGTRRANDRGQPQPKDRSDPSNRDNKKQQQQQQQQTTGGGSGGNKGSSGGENRPPRQTRNRGRLPSKEKQETGERSGGNADDVGGSGPRDTRSRPRWNDRNSGGRERPEHRDEGGERSGGNFRSRPPRGGFRGGKREFERRSGNDKTSVKPLDKKEGAGSHNWGTVQDDLNTSVGEEWVNDDGEQPPPQIPDVPAVENTNETEENGKSSDKPQDEDGNQETTVDTEKVEEEITLTLDEYKAKQEKKRFVPNFKERKPGENEDTTKWKDTIVYERNDAELIPGSREVVEKYKSSGRVRTSVESSFFFKDTSRFPRGGGPGKRGGPDRRQFEERGQEDRRPRRTDGERRPRRFDDENPRRGGGGGGGNRNRDRSNFNVEDEKDFPSLGTVSA